MTTIPNTLRKKGESNTSKEKELGIDRKKEWIKKNKVSYRKYVENTLNQERKKIYSLDLM